jgi:ATP-dependent Clp protease ATP-binding subunit ClpB
VTSNIGSLHLLDGIDAHGEIRDDARGQLLGELRAHVRPESSTASTTPCCSSR